MSGYVPFQERNGIRFRSITTLTIIIIVFSSTIFSSLSEAQINGLSSTETANVESALDQLEEIDWEEILTRSERL